MSSSHKADPSLIPDIEAFEKRAAIAQYDGGLTVDEAEDLAAQDQGFGSAADYWHWLASYVANRGLAYANQNKPRPAAHCEWSGFFCCNLTESNVFFPKFFVSRAKCSK